MLILINKLDILLLSPSKKLKLLDLKNNELKLSKKQNIIVFNVNIAWCLSLKLNILSSIKHVIRFILIK